jgi:hypothetical protein
MSGYAFARLDEIDEVDDGREPFRPVRHHFGIRSFGITAWTARAAGDRIINEHDESDDRHEELYVVMQGRAAFELDGERVEAPTGTLVRVQPEVRRTAFAEEAGTTILSIGARPGHAYVPDGWELWAPLRPLYDAGDYAGVVERGRAPIEAAQYAGPLYNLACCEALAGRKDDAVEHLRQAIGTAERFRDHAKGDPDFDSIRDEPGFAELVGP